MTIRPANSADSPGAAAVIRAVFEEYGFTWEPDGYHADLADVEETYWQDGCSFFVAEVEGKIVGTVAVDVFPRLPEGETTSVDEQGHVRVASADCSLERMYLLPGLRGQGIGRALFAQALEWATPRASVMEIWSDKRLTLAHRFYEAAGATCVGDRICPGDPDESWEWGYRLVLSGS